MTTKYKAGDYAFTAESVAGALEMHSKGVDRLVRSDKLISEPLS